MIKINNYNITFADESNLDQLLMANSSSSIAVLTDENTVEFCLPLLFEQCSQPFNIITIPSGEQNKTIDTCNYIWEKMMELNMDRHSILINLGGGVIGDMGGFCAATYMRGIKFIHIPTTLLSQVDSSVGSKLGIDFGNYKNMVGLFCDPIEVIVDTKYLTTLPYRQLTSGFAEVLKHGLIADRGLWDTTSQIEIITDLDLIEIIKKSIQIKVDIVNQDPFEKGVRKTLNFGHTIGHAIESYALTTTNPLLHGEAISIGMICESYISWKRDLISESEYKSIKEQIIRLFGKKSKSVPEPNILIKLMSHDKKNRAGRILMSLLNGIGKSTYDHEIRTKEIEESISEYKQQ